MIANIIPYISVADNWKKHFTDMVNDNNLKRKKIYIVGKNQHGKGDSDAIIKMVTPTKEAIDRARAVISKKKTSLILSRKKVILKKEKRGNTIIVEVKREPKRRHQRRKGNFPRKRNLSFLCNSYDIIMFKFKGASDKHSDNIAVFNLPPTDAGLESFEWIEYRPSGQLLTNSPVEFNVFGTSTTYVDLRSTLLYIKLQITTGNDIPVVPANNVGLINLPLRTIWSQVDFTLQQQILTSSVSTNYAYKSILDFILNKDLKKHSNMLQTEGFFKDNADGLENADALQGQNNALFYRYQLTKDGQIVEFMGGLSLDLMDDFQNRFLINGVQLGIKLWPNKKEFCLLSAEENADYKVNIVGAKLKLKHVKLTLGAFIGHQEAISKHDALYLF